MRETMHLLNQLRDTLLNQNDSSAGETLPPSEVYSLLSNDRRRKIIIYLAEMEGSTTTASEIADYLSALGDDRTSCYISITQHQAPAMSRPSSQIIKYDERSKEIKVLPALRTVYQIHKDVEKHLE